jgi:hypothetical protein
MYYPMLMTTISLKLPDDLLARLEEETKLRNTTKSSFVRTCLQKALEAPTPDGQRSCYDLARDLAGSLKGLPRDLAINSKYFEAFGR